jgi:hypothetical protein
MSISVRLARESDAEEVARLTAQLGYHRVELSFDAAAHTAIVQGKATAVPPAANVLLVDNIDRPGGEVIKFLSIDPAGVDLYPRLGLSAWAPLLARSREVVEFLQCDAVPVDPRSLEPCQYLSLTPAAASPQTAAVAPQPTAMPASANRHGEPLAAGPARLTWSGVGWCGSNLAAVYSRAK